MAYTGFTRFMPIKTGHSTVGMTPHIQGNWVRISDAQVAVGQARLDGLREAAAAICAGCKSGEMALVDGNDHYHATFGGAHVPCEASEIRWLIQRIENHEFLNRHIPLSEIEIPGDSPDA